MREPQRGDKIPPETAEVKAMAMKVLSLDDHRQVLQRLVEVSTRAGRVRAHAAGLGYTSLMMCFLCHSKSAAESLQALYRAFGNDWFPVTVGYIIVRSLFEVDVTAHVSRDPGERSNRYIAFGGVINKQRPDAVLRHRSSPEPSWREAMTEAYTREWLPREANINATFAQVRPLFEKKGGSLSTSWSGKTLKEMAREVNHLEAYEVIYAELSSFTHMNVKAADRFLRVKPDGPIWTQHSGEFDVGNVFRYAAFLLTCFLELFGTQFAAWSREDVQECWELRQR